MIATAAQTVGQALAVAKMASPRRFAKPGETLPIGEPTTPEISTAMTMSIEDQRRRFRQFHLAVHVASEAWALSGWSGPLIPPTLPDDLNDLRCGAKTRKGTPCASKAIYLNGRCKHHGGLSTGPRTIAGRAASRNNLKMRWGSV